MTAYEQFIAKLEQNGIEYVLLRYFSCTYVEVGRFGYRFEKDGRSTGGWIRHPYTNDEWQDWMALLR